MFITEEVQTGMCTGESEGMARLIARCPFSLRPFPYEGFPFPISQLLTGGWPNVGVLLKTCKEAHADNIYNVLETVLPLAECVESQSFDIDRRVLPPEDILRMAQSGDRHMAGWVLLLGPGDLTGMAHILTESKYRVFTTRPKVPETTFLGGRETALVFFVQALMVRAWKTGGVEPGDTDALKDFLERRTPAAVVATGPLSPMEELLVAGMMKLDIPAVTPPDFRFACGRVAFARTPEEVLDQLSQLPTARVAHAGKQLIAMPKEASLDHIDKPFKTGVTFGGKDSFFHAATGARSDGFEVHGTPGKKIGVLIQLGGTDLDEVTLGAIETRLTSGLDELDGLRCEGLDPLVIHARNKGALDGDVLARLVWAAAHIHFDRIPKVHVTVTFDSSEIARLQKTVARQRRARRRVLSSIKEETSDYFYACMGCYSLKNHHCCIITPDHPPLCGLSWEQIKTISQLTPSPRAAAAGEFRSFRPVVISFRRGRKAGSPERGEYAGVNEITRETTEGAVEKVWLHSLLENPPTTSSRFEVLAFNMRGADGIGLADSHYQGPTPEGRSVRQLAYDATGMQRPGVRGVSFEYLLNKRFLEADGGWKKVKWVNARLKERLLAAGFEAVKKIATEHNATSEDQLKQFYAPKKRRPRKTAASKSTAAKPKKKSAAKKAATKKRVVKKTPVKKTVKKNAAAKKKTSQRKSLKKKTPKKTSVKKKTKPVTRKKPVKKTSARLSKKSRSAKAKRTRSRRKK